VLLGFVEPFEVDSARSVSLKLGPRMGPRNVKEHLPCRWFALLRFGSALAHSGTSPRGSVGPKPVEEAKLYPLVGWMHALAPRRADS